MSIGDPSIFSEIDIPPANGVAAMGGCDDGRVDTHERERGDCQKP